MPLTKDQILEDLKTSREQYENGEYLDFDEALDEIRGNLWNINKTALRELR